MADPYSDYLKRAENYELLAEEAQPLASSTTIAATAMKARMPSTIPRGVGSGPP
ncbi:MAG: hypothetical protein ACRD1R_12125 [Acidobacteriota bacterium]